MHHKLILKHLGPVNYCEVDIDAFTVFTGPQSNGKSTIAKAIYFFRTIKQDILSIMMQGGPTAISERKNAEWISTLKQRMRDKFLQLFGTSWVMPDGMEMIYSYSRQMSIRVFLKPDPNSFDRNFVEFEFSDAFQDYLEDLDNHSFLNINTAQKHHEESTLTKKLDDPYETVFIPAGRNLITLLSTQLNYIFTSLEGTQLRNIDYITKRYTELILKLKPLFEQGMLGFLFDLENAPERMKRYKKHKVAIQMLQQAAEEVLNGTYRYVDGEERLYLDNSKYIKINYTSSGQQETVWIFNLLFYYLVEDKKIFLILEEPESHLYPESQQIIATVLSLFFNEGNAGLITTHSPYVLGTFNYLLLASQADKAVEESIKKKLHKHYWLNPSSTAAYYIHDGHMESALDTDDDLTLINNGLIDGASEQINSMNDYIIEQLYDVEGKHE